MLLVSGCNLVQLNILLALLWTSYQWFAVCLLAYSSFVPGRECKLPKWCKRLLRSAAAPITVSALPHLTLLPLTLKSSQENCSQTSRVAYDWFFCPHSVDGATVSAMRHTDSIVGRTVFRKATHVNLCVRNQSFTCPTPKLSAVATLADRARKMAVEEQLQEELNFLWDIFSQHGYALRDINTVMP